MKKLSTSLAITLISLMLTATQAHAAFGWSDTFAINLIQTIHDERVAIASSTSPLNGCSWFRFYTGQAGVTSNDFKITMATLQGAFALGKQIRVHFDDATSNCYARYIQVYY